MSEFSKTKTSYYRRLYVAYLIEQGTNTVKSLLETTGMPLRTLQDTLRALKELDIEVVTQGGTKNATYSIVDWGAINSNWIKMNLKHVKSVLKLL